MDFHGPRTQILENDTAENTTTVVYTVPVGKTFWLVEAELSCDAGAIGISKASIRNELDVYQRSICCVKIGATATAIKADHFNPGFPVELKTGWDIIVESDVSGLVSALSIFGFEVDT